MSGHTPGPWCIGPEHYDDEGHREIPVYANVADMTVYPAVICLQFANADGMQEANARLIAAAPELLEALEYASRTVSHLAFHLRGRLGESALAELERLGTEWGEVVAKAKGGAL